MSLLLAAAAAGLFLFAASSLMLRDKEPVVFGALLLAGMGLLRGRRAAWGAGLLGLVFANTSFWMAAGALSTITHHGATMDLVLPAAHAAMSLVGLVAAGGVLVRRADRTAPSRAAAWVGIAALGLLAATLLGNLALNPVQPVAARPGDLTLSSDDAAFSKTKLTAAPGEITVRLSNGDLFWHTFTIDELDVDLKAPVNGERALTFTASPGSYRFYCRIPGHELAGMRGSLIVR